MQKLYRKLEKKAQDIKSQKFVVIINGEEYETENEVLESYGCDMITSTQKDNALRKFEEHEQNEEIKVINVELNWLNDIIATLEQRKREI